MRCFPSAKETTKLTKRNRIRKNKSPAKFLFMLKPLIRLLRFIPLDINFYFFPAALSVYFIFSRKCLTGFILFFTKYETKRNYEIMQKYCLVVFVFRNF